MTSKNNCILLTVHAKMFTRMMCTWYVGGNLAPNPNAGNILSLIVDQDKVKKNEKKNQLQQWEYDWNSKALLLLIREHNMGGWIGGCGMISVIN